MRPKILQTLILFLAVNTFVGCGVSAQNDIYEIIPKGTHLNKAILRKAQQFYPIGDELIVIYNISKDPERYDPHLLFFDKHLRMVSACYFPSERIDSIRSNIIYSVLNESRESRKESYRNDLPERYSLKFKVVANGSGSQINKLIDKISVDSSKLVLEVRLTDEQGISWAKSARDTSVLSTFTKKKTVTSNLADFTFNRQDGLISKRSFDMYNRLTWDDMIVYDDAIWTHFYEQLWKYLQTRMSHSN
jgi:hypothetical protein